MSIDTYKVVIGACGWQYPQWQPEFYPDDLPEDWQLGYYGNEFLITYVSADNWLENADIEQWLDNVSDEFRFILEIPAAAISDQSLLSKSLEKVKTFKSFCAGVVFRFDTASEMPADWQSQPVVNALTSATKLAPVCIDTAGEQADESMLQQLDTLNISRVWHGDEDNMSGFEQGALSVARIASEHMDAKKLRGVLETCISVSDGRVSVLIVDGAPPSLDVLNNAGIILDLL